MIAAQLSIIEARLIPGSSTSKIIMGDSVSPVPLTISGGGFSTIENTSSTIEHNDAGFTLKSVTNFRQMLAETDTCRFRGNML